MTLFFPECNKKATINMAKRKLREYPVWRRVANDPKEQRITQLYSFIPRSPSGAPSKVVENLAVDKVSAESELETIENAVSSILNQEYRKILIDKYLLSYPKSDQVIADELGYERSRYFELLQNALMQFAEFYKNGALVVKMD